MANDSRSVTPQEYDAWYDSPRGQWIGNVEFELLCRYLDAKPGTSLLDVGCGTGWFTRRLAASGLDVTSMDVDDDALDFAHKQSDIGISYVVGDACHLSFLDKSFDQVVSTTALCFIDDWPRAITEIVRVARNHFVLGLLNRHSLLWFDKGRSGGKGAYQGAHWHTRRELDVALKNLPIENVQFGSAIFLPSGTAFAQILEQAIPTSFSWGSFLIVSGDIRVDANA